MYIHSYAWKGKGIRKWASLFRNWLEEIWILQQFQGAGPLLGIYHEHAPQNPDKGLCILLRGAPLHNELSALGPQCVGALRREVQVYIWRGNLQACQERTPGSVANWKRSEILYPLLGRTGAVTRDAEEEPRADTTPPKQFCVGGYL